jgi:S-adenosylmethionine:tRNA ribosyltransferase-isomerase
MRRSDFNYDLPSELIAQTPLPERAASRLLVFNGATGRTTDRRFADLPELLRAGDLLVLNDTRVVPARLLGRKPSGGRVEIMLERVVAPRRMLAHVRASHTPRVGGVIELPGGAAAHVLGRAGTLFELELDCDVEPLLAAHGQVPLPPYIERTPDAQDLERYQTVFARAPGAVAAPTAGLHFDEQLLAALERGGVELTRLTLHVGAGTFAPVRSDEIERHELHAERVVVGADVCAAVTRYRARGGRVVAVGTTVVRALETAAAAQAVAAAPAAAAAAAGPVVSSAVAAAAAAAEPAGGRADTLAPYSGDTRLFIYPGFRFRVVDAMVTNFHLPESSLLMLVAAFAGREATLAAYADAVRERYRFFSYGDAMFVTPA